MQGNLLFSTLILGSSTSILAQSSVAKYADDTTLFEVIASSSYISNMQSLLNQFVTWSDHNNMQSRLTA